MTAPFDPVQAAFENAMRDFQAELNDGQIYSDILKVTTIDQVYDATDKIQKEQAKEGRLRHLSRISPFLDRINEYAAAVEVFIQVKPEILALIWGPVRLLLQWTSALRTSFDAIINVMAEISEVLPEFKRVAALFDQNAAIKDVMVLFFRDMLDFYLIALKFFKMPRWKFFFEPLWPKHKDKIKVVMTHIDNHGRLMRNEVRLEHIQQEHEARRRALEYYEQEERSRRDQEFYRIKTDIAPQSHDERLDGIQARVYQGTGTWLLENATFKEWLRPATASSRLLWLQGIPGAGKTYLASTVINKAQSLGRTAFAFLSYKQHHYTTAMNVIHSLIFRLASGEDDLQTVVCQSFSEESKRSLQGAAELLCTVLACAGPSYMIVDGLDEMEQVERGRLLSQLLVILKSSHETSLFISSRAEADLTSILRKEATVIRVDQKNLECIQTFVKQWLQRWFIEREFWPEEQTEIEASLAPLAARSQGMFLYARVVLSSIEFLDTYGNILEELHVLPETLDDAYDRVLKRINSQDIRSLKEKARTVLGWIACSPTALTVQEIQQALAIDLANRGNASRIRGNLDLVRICGPIVEIVDGYVQFVHFTVKEYIFSSQISGSIDLSSATLDLALRCITYLCQAHHDITLEDEDIHHNICTGVYVLDWFATNMWSQITNTYLSTTRQEGPHPELVAYLDVLHTLRFQDLSLEEGDIDGLFPNLDTLKEVHPEVHNLLCQALRFREVCAASEHRMRRGAPWIVLDPLTTSEISARIYHAIEQLHCQKWEDGQPGEQMLQRWYGQRLYKCEYLHCQFNRIGFETSSKRHTHEKNHDLPWKCGIAACEYANGGFLSRKMRDDHFNQAHSNKDKKAVGLSQEEDDEENKLLLIDLVRAGLVDNVDDLLSSTALKTLDSVTKEKVFCAAVLSGSLPMVELCMSKLCNQNVYTPGTPTIIVLAIQLRSVEILRCLLCYIDGGDASPPILAEVVSKNDYEISDMIIKWIKDAKARKGYTVSSLLASQETIRASAKDRSKEEFLIKLWGTLWSESDDLKFDKRFLGDALVAVAATTCSVDLVEYLLASGAEVDYRRSAKYYTPLCHAARQDTAEAAELMRFLLHHGADPDAEHVDRRRIYKNLTTKIRDQKGPKGISKWLGITWDELVAETQGIKQ
ncbi:NACHT domain protein [Xylariaceae sp. FL1651]|nr:NACHT domain protein [Xylariaceae sp. FL1651]